MITTAEAGADGAPALVRSTTTAAAAATAVAVFALRGGHGRQAKHCGGQQGGKFATGIHGSFLSLKSMISDE